MNTYTRRAAIVLLLFITHSQAGAAGEAELINQYMARWHETGRFNGTVLVAKDGDVVCAKGFGLADHERNIPNGPDTRFKIMSISKQFTTVLVLQLAAEGRIDLDAKLTEYLPDYRKDTGDRVTIDHLLQHTAGIPCYINDGHLRPEGKPVYDWAAQYDRDRFVRDFLSGDFLFEPGTQYKYSNTGYYLLALVIEAVTGDSYGENLERRILKPLGMTNTGVDTDSRSISNLALGYAKAPGGFVTGRPSNPDNLLGAGNLYSTVGDLLAWNLALESAKVLPEKWRDKMFEVYWEEAREGHAYSLNYFAYPGRNGEEVRFTGFSGGGPTGFNTDAYRFPDSGLIVVILENSSQYNHWRIGPGINEIMAGNESRMPRPLLSDALVETVARRGLPSALVQYKDIEENHRDEYARGPDEREINAYGYGALGQGDVDLAIEILKLNVELFPNSWNVYDSLGEAYLAAGEAKLSEQNYAIAREVRDRQDVIIEQLRQGDYDGAREIVARAHAKDPDVQLLEGARIGPFFEQVLSAGDYEKALEVCSVWALANPGTPGPYFSLARVHKGRGDVDEAKACYHKIIEMQPDGRAAEAARKMMEEADGGS
jgi:CubicO group peptidase (beta-lactamase class C family)